MYPKAILFDLDDTLISFDEVTETAWEEVCCSFVNLMRTSFSSTELFESIKRVRQWYWSDPERHRIGRQDILKARREIVMLALKELQYFDVKEACRLADNYSKRYLELTNVFPDSISTLDRLKELGIKMVLITNDNAENQRWKLGRFSLEGYFEFCLFGGEVGFGKSDVRIFELALKRLGLKTDEVWMVGDNLIWDIQVPQSLGIFSIWNDYKRAGLPRGSTIAPDRIINSVSELLDITGQIKELCISKTDIIS